MHNQVRKLLIITILLFGYVGKSQILTSYYTDRCTGETKVFTVPMNGQTVVSFYDQSRVFSSQDFKNGSLQSWLEGVYLRWTNFSPCSQSQVTITATQQTVQQTATEATKAATAAAAQTPATVIPAAEPPVTVTPVPETSVVDTPSASTGLTKNTTNETSTTSSKSPVTESENTSSQTSGNDTSSGTSEGNTSSESNSTNDSSSTETGDTNENQGSESSDSESTESTESQEGDNTSSEESEDSSSEGNDTEGESDDSDDSKSDEQEEVAEEEEIKEEESKEESEEDKEDESTEETEEEESEEDKEDESTEETEEDEEEEEKKKKKNVNPPIVVANVSSMENLLGSFDVAMTLGVSRSSLRGDKTYALNSMIWSNLKQYMLMVNFSKVFFVKGIPKYVYSTSLMGSRMYSTLTAGSNHSIVRLGKKGSVIGISAGATSIFLNYQVSKEGIYLDTSLLSISLTGFYTKSYNFERFSLSPMVAFSLPLHMQDLYSNTTIENKDIAVITGVSGNYALSKRFVLNLGVNVSSNTNKEIKSLLSFTIGSRFQF